MALKRKLTAGWYLSDGILNTFPIGDARDALSAAVEAGFAPDPLRGMNLMKAEWVYNRRWTYSSHFDAPLEDDERVWLLFERLCGAGEVWVNGGRAAAFEGGETLAEVTRLICAGENELTVRFEAPHLRLPSDDPMPLLGMVGNVWLLTGNFLSLERLRSRAKGSALTVDLDLAGCRAGRYLFAYTASLDGALWRRWRFEETLEEGAASLTHTLDRLDQGEAGGAEAGRALEIRLDVTHSGVGCAQARFEALAPGGGTPRRTMLVRGGALTPAVAEALLTLGADSVCLEGETARRVDADCVHGLKKIPWGQAFSCPACAGDLQVSAEGEVFWPPRAPLWRLRGGQAPDVAALSALYGEKVREDGALAARLTRYEQAEAVLRYALACRQSGERAVLPWNAPWESLCSDALTERGGRHRMACDALRRAWRREAAWADWPVHFAAEPGEELEIALWAATDRPGGLEAVLSACAFGLDGQCLARQRENVRVNAAARVGTMAVTAPKEGALIVRCALQDGAGETLCRLDRVLTVRGRGAPQEAIFATAASLKRSRAGVINEGGVAALAPGECLLPGERAQDAGEWVNEAPAAL